MNKYYKMLGWLSVLLFTQAPHADEKQNIGAQNFSAIVETDGYAYLAEDKTIAQLRELALINAKRNALEKGQTYLQSYSKVENYMLTFDIIQSQSEGKVKIIESKDYGVVAENRYRYWIKAQIEYTPIIPVQAQEPDLSQTRTGPLCVKMWSEKRTYEAGEFIKVYFKGNRNFYAYLLYMDSQNNLTQILPNQLSKENYFSAGKTVTIPDPIDGYQLRVGPPFGKEKIILYAGETPLGSLESSPIGESLLRVKSELDAAELALKRISLSSHDQKTYQPGDFFKAVVEIETVPSENLKIR